MRRRLSIECTGTVTESSRPRDARGKAIHPKATDPTTNNSQTADGALVGFGRMIFATTIHTARSWRTLRPSLQTQLGRNASDTDLQSLQGCETLKYTLRQDGDCVVCQGAFFFRVSRERDRVQQSDDVLATRSQLHGIASPLRRTDHVRAMWESPEGFIATQ